MKIICANCIQEGRIQVPLGTLSHGLCRWHFLALCESAHRQGIGWITPLERLELMIRRFMKGDPLGWFAITVCGTILSSYLIGWVVRGFAFR
ncbi:MAG: hypothetical protein KGL39_46880 [Patescibacteria group bacterium]|nr:hypothetical protein [Patescibacteria group bacterium]